MPVINTDPEPSLCAGCGGKIIDRYYLLAVDKQWHVNCLKCCECKLRLDSELTCFAKDGSIYCKEDYYRWVLSPFNYIPFRCTCMRLWTCIHTHESCYVFMYMYTCLHVTKLACTCMVNIFLSYACIRFDVFAVLCYNSGRRLGVIYMKNVHGGSKVWKRLLSI